MSIIYNALKKIQKSNPQNLPGDSKKNLKSHRLAYVISILMILAGFYIAKLVFDNFTRKIEAKQTRIVKPADSQSASVSVESKPAVEERVASVSEGSVTRPAISEKRSLPSLTLNGILFDEEQPCALINNRIAKEGDDIGGAKVIRILSDEVVLEFEGKTIRLRTN
jgi:type II secretory pathway component PulC